MIFVLTNSKNCFKIVLACEKMVDVAQLVRAPGCGPGGRGFESHLSPHFLLILSVAKLRELV